MKHFLPLVFLFSAIISFSQIPTIGLVAYYPCSGNAGDSSGNNNHATVVGATLTTSKWNTANSAYSFNGDANHLTVPANSSINLTDSMTLSMWVKLNMVTVPNSAHHLMVKGTNTTNEYSLTLLNTTRKLCFNKQGATIKLKSSHSIDTNWTLLTVTYKYPVAKIYINGVLDTTSTDTFHIKASNTNLTIGSIDPFYISQNTVNGAMDEIRIYNRALSASEVSSLYSLSNGIHHYDISGAIKIYPNPAHHTLYVEGMDAGTEIQLQDLTGKTVLVQTISNDRSIHVESLTPGMYLLNTGSVVQKILIN